MKNILEFKNKIRSFQEGVDYNVREDKGDKIYTVRGKDLKDFFWGDTSDNSEYRVVVDKEGSVVSSERNVVVNSPQSIREESLRRGNLETSSKSSVSSFSYSQKDDNPQSQDNREDNESDDENGGEKFFYGLRQEIAPGETTGKIEKTVYHRRKEGGKYVEDKMIIDDFDNEVNETNSSSRFQEITDEDVKMTETEKKEKAEKEKNEYFKNKRDKETQKSQVSKVDPKSGGSGDKLVIPFIGGGLFLFIIGVVLLVKP